jgi:hypothetical protein
MERKEGREKREREKKKGIEGGREMEEKGGREKEMGRER